jgi:hypothetical protein
MKIVLRNVKIDKNDEEIRSIFEGGKYQYFVECYTPYKLNGVDKSLYDRILFFTRDELDYLMRDFATLEIGLESYDQKRKALYTALESLAIIAYKQPITKGEVEAIRGVNSDYSIQKLLEKELITISGRNEHLPGKPLVYSTSKNFMDYFGINSTDDLPKIREVLADQLVEATVIKPEDFTDNSVLEQIEEEETPNLPEETDGYEAESNEEDETPESPVH